MSPSSNAPRPIPRPESSHAEAEAPAPAPASAGPLQGTVALVAGATRGGGRGIAIALGEAGATVICTGRSSRATTADPQEPRDSNEHGDPTNSSDSPDPSDSTESTHPTEPSDPAGPFSLDGRSETIEQTAALVTAAGGVGVAVRCDHSDPAQVDALLESVAAAHGRLDILVHSIWGGDALAQWGMPFWEQDPALGFRMWDRALRTHVQTARAALPLMLASGGRLVVEVTDGDAQFYRGSFYYDLAKHSAMRMAFAWAEELRPRGIASVAVTPGFLRSEVVLDFLGVTEDSWREGIAKDPHFAFSESPRYVGRAIAALAAAPDLPERSGRAFSSWGLMREFGFTDLDGSQPDWGAHAQTEDFGADHRASHTRFVTGFGGAMAAGAGSGPSVAQATDVETDRRAEGASP